MITYGHVAMIVASGAIGWILADVVKMIKPTFKIRIKRNKIHK